MDKVSLRLLTSIAQLSMHIFDIDFFIRSKTFFCASCSSTNSETPPVKSSIASDALPPFKAEYEPFSL